MSCYICTLPCVGKEGGRVYVVCVIAKTDKPCYRIRDGNLFILLHRNRLLATMDSRGSFLDDMSRLSMQSVSAVDLTNQLKQLKFSTSSDHSPPDKAAAGDSGPNLIQFSGATDLGSADQETK